MQEIHISYSELRSLVTRVIAHVSEKTGIDARELDVNFLLNGDGGIDGDDADELLIELQQKEGLQLEGFNFYDHFMDEAEVGGGSWLWPISHMLFAPAGIVLYLFKTSPRIWSLKDLKTLLAWPQHRRTNSFPQPLSIGDLITSKLEGRFVPRNERRYVIKMKNRQHPDGSPVTEQ